MSTLEIIYYELRSSMIKGGINIWLFSLFFLFSSFSFIKILYAKKTINSQMLFTTSIFDNILVLAAISFFSFIFIIRSWLSLYRNFDQFRTIKGFAEWKKIARTNDKLIDDYKFLIEEGYKFWGWLEQWSKEDLEKEEEYNRFLDENSDIFLPNNKFKKRWLPTQNL